ncbi:hypothetical protein C8R44DRAFT_761767 [Mycena epipterygia]|nr:hypothetical protein C8R44DRAFT_761767 [Mycena epipterygia]
MQTLIENLVQKRDELNQFIDSHLALLSPARRLPPDVVRAIFTASLPSTRNSIMAGEDSPLLLCRICSAWRQLAISTPRLWSSLHIVVPGRSRINGLVEMVTLWLSRSGIIPLSISVILSKACEYYCDLKPLLHFLATFSPRWKSIRITLPTLDDFDVFASLSAEDVPMLQDVLVGGVFAGTSLGANSPWRSLAFLAAPSLLSLSINEGRNFAALNFLSKRLVHLRIRDNGTEGTFPLTYVTVLGLLQQFPVLETCDLALVGEAESPWTGGSVILPHFRHFGLDDRSPEGQSDSLFTAFVFPNLRSVDYSLFFTSGNALPFSVFVPALERLSLGITHIQSTVLLDFLRPAQRLEELHLTGNLTNPWDGWVAGEPDTTFLLTHFGPDSEEPLCPHLRRLQLRNASAVSDDDLLAIIQARTAPQRDSNARLIQFSATMTRQMQRDIMPELQPLIDEGLDVSFAYHPPLFSAVYSPWEGVSQLT